MQKDIVIEKVRLLEKSGGKSGHFIAEENTNVLFFAQTRELIGIDVIQLEDDFAHCRWKRCVNTLLKRAINGHWALEKVNFSGN